MQFEINFKELLSVFAPFDAAFPEHQEHFDRLFYYVLVKLDGYCASFEDFRKNGIITRRERKNLPKPTNDELIFLCINLANQTRNIALNFPDIAIHADRAIYEVINSLKPIGSSFEDFHKNLHMTRVALTARVKGVG